MTCAHFESSFPHLEEQYTGVRRKKKFINRDDTMKNEQQEAGKMKGFYKRIVQ